MLKNNQVSHIQSNRLWMMIALSSVALFAAACGASSTPSVNSGNPPRAIPTASEVVPTQVPSSGKTDACVLLTQDDVSTALGVTVISAESLGLGGVCTYKTADLKIDFTTAGNMGGIDAMATQLASLGNLALIVPGLGDQAFYNTNAGSPLFLLKGDAEYLFSISSINYQPLDATAVQATEKLLAVELLSKLP
jgi:hypothetical protein